MSDTLAHNAGAFMIVGMPEEKPASPAVAATTAESDAPVGYRWVSKRWRVMPDGKRDYAAFHGKTAFSYLLPVSSRLHTRKP
jgi:hypothetical protein